jgi:PKD repeat protein
MDADHSLTAVFTEVSEEENQRPHAFLSVNSTTINVNEVVLCNASESYDSDGQIMLYFFDFGDETNTGWITSSSISHSYMTEGEYSINLIVEDDQGLTNSSEFTLSVIITVIPEFSSYIILAFAIMILMISIFKRKINNNP